MAKKKLATDDKGQFVKGNEGGGNKTDLSRARDFKKALHQAITFDDIVEVLHKLRDCAKRGESWAITDFLNRTLGKPTEHIEVEERKYSHVEVIQRFDAILGIDRLGEFKRAQAALPQRAGIVVGEICSRGAETSALPSAVDAGRQSAKSGGEGTPVRIHVDGSPVERAAKDSV